MLVVYVLSVIKRNKQSAVYDSRFVVVFSWTLSKIPKISYCWVLGQARYIHQTVGKTYNETKTVNDLLQWSIKGSTMKMHYK